MKIETIKIHAPTFPESIENGEIIAWNKKIGESFERDEVLAEIETDKIVMEIPAHSSGTLLHTDKCVGDTVTSDEVIGVMSIAYEKTTPLAKNTAIIEEKIIKIGPAARKLAKEHGINIDKIKATGKHGTVTKADILAHIQQQTPSDTATPPINDGQRTTTNVPMTRLRSTIAQRLLDIQHSRAILTTFNEVDLHTVNHLRKHYKETFINKHGVKLGLMSFFVQACCEALKKHPIINAASNAHDITYHDYQDIGIAVSTERGLLVPILRDAAHKSLANIEKNIVDFATRARENKIELEELQGGTFTITNGGVFGSLLSTPIINPPQSAILGMHTIQQRPIAKDNAIVIRPMMYLALSYDHRIIDGKEAVQFLCDIKETLENPGKLLLNL